MSGPWLGVGGPARLGGSGREKKTGWLAVWTPRRVTSGLLIVIIAMDNFFSVSKMEPLANFWYFLGDTQMIHENFGDA